MKHARAMLVEATSTALARDGDTCKTFDAKPVLISQTSESEVALKEQTKQFKVINTAEAEVAVGDRMLAIQDISGFWVRAEPSGGGDQIQGEILSISNGEGDYAGKIVASIEVAVAPCNQPGLIGTAVDVVDWSGCVFDLTEEELIGIWAWANRGVALSQDPYAEAGQLTPCHWVAADRCCIPGEGA